MNDRVVEMIERPNGQERVLIVQRGDHRYAFRREWREDENYKGTGVFVWDDGYPEEPGSWPRGPYLGVYDGAETVRAEATERVDWLALKAAS